MALKYEDYAQKHLEVQGGLQAQIPQAAHAQQVREQAAPENIQQGYTEPAQFAGKSREQVIQSFQELQTMNSRQAQDLGSMRTLVDNLAMNPQPVNGPAPVEETKPITSDDLYDRPAETINDVVSRHPALQRLDNLERQLGQERVEKAQTRFTTKHPDYQMVVGSPEFQGWVAADQTRVGLYHSANNFDFGAADILISLCKAETGLALSQGAVERQEQLHDGMLETGGHYEPPPPETFSRQEWLKTMTRGKQGDLEAEDYINRNYPKYREALAAGNVRD